LTVGSLEPGEWRHLTRDELLTLRASVQPRGHRRS
jgi:hypothetical protein